MKTEISDLVRNIAFPVQIVIICSVRHTSLSLIMCIQKKSLPFAILCLTQALHKYLYQKCEVVCVDASGNQLVLPLLLLANPPSLEPHPMKIDTSSPSLLPRPSLGLLSTSSVQSHAWSSTSVSCVLRENYKRKKHAVYHLPEWELSSHLLFFFLYKEIKKYFKEKKNIKTIPLLYFLAHG